MLSLMRKAQCGLNLLKGSQDIRYQADQAFDRYLGSKKCDERERRASEREFATECLLPSQNAEWQATTELGWA